MQGWNLARLEFIEEFKIMLLKNAFRVLGIFKVSKGGISGASADRRIFFATALKANATGIILAHNHSSGRLAPSDADNYITENMRKAGYLLNIRILDHLIVTAEGFCSFRKDGLFEVNKKIQKTTHGISQRLNAAMQILFLVQPLLGKPIIRYGYIVLFSMAGTGCRMHKR